MSNQEYVEALNSTKGAVVKRMMKLEAENAKLKRENKFMRHFLERQSIGWPCPDTATSVLLALEKM